MTEQELIQGCKSGNRKCQKLLYEQYASVLYPICLRYLRHREDAEDVLLETFYKIFSKIEKYSFKGSFEGWMKRICINEALMHLRKRNNFNLSIDAVSYHMKDDSHTIEDHLFADDIMHVVEQLPDGYRTVFNLFVIEGYKHREIAEILGISINTSKSQLIQAKRKLASILKKNRISNTG